MSQTHFNEEQLVEIPALDLLRELRWETASALEESFGEAGTFGRIGAGDVALLPRLRTALQKLNPALPPEAIEAGIAALTRDRSAMELTAANRQVYQLLKEGVPVMVRDAQTGGQKTERLRVIDWDNPDENDFLAVRQMSFVGALYTCRPDVVCFVNGLPLAVLEFKKPGVPARRAFEDNITSYKHPQNGVPRLFWYNAVLIASNGTESRVGSVTADWDRFFEWKRVESEDEARKVSLETVLRGVCDRARFLDITENFIVFSEYKTGLAKILAQNHQYLGVNNAITATMKAREEKHGRGGVFWQTQGSGKSFAMVFYAQKILRKHSGNWTFVVVTDRIELDDQIAKTFAACGAVTDSSACHAESGEHLRQLLGGNQRYVFTLIHKFQSTDLLCDRSDVIVLTDEAHRSQYDTLALNMRSALPKATFIAFTGTPLIAGEERTREVFGDYVSIYDFQQSVEDGATVPLFYENRTPELHLENPTLNEDLYKLIDEAELSEAAEQKLSTELGQQYHLLTRNDRLEAVAKDIVSHFLGRGFQGKAMVVSIDKATALKMHDKVQKHWLTEQKRVAKRIDELDAVKSQRTDEQLAELADLKERMRVLLTAETAVVVSAEQNEIEKLAREGLDIVPHRRRIKDSKEGIDEEFKDPKSDLRLVFVCAMWLTGFDAPSCSTIYLDKPMRNHTLMQTIARANRVFPGKQSGLIVDYANVFSSLEKALAIYGKGKGGETPVRDKKELVGALRSALDEAEKFCADNGVNISDIQNAQGLDRLTLLAIAVNSLISPDELRKTFLAKERLGRLLYRAVQPDPVVIEFAPRVYLLATLADTIREKTGGEEQPDISPIMERVRTLLDESIAAEGFTIQEGTDGARHGVIDLTKIDFEKLASKFKQSRQKNIDIERLKVAIRGMLERMVRLNRTRADFQQRFEELIASYNAGSRSIDVLFEELVKLSKDLTKEETRHVRENLHPEELTIFDILTRPAPELSDNERDEVKKVVRELLLKVKKLLNLDWRQTASGRANVKIAIEEALDSGLPRAYDKPMFEAKVKALFQHIYEEASCA